jgi:capsular exopolysaccharide synthesis family protein
MELEDYTRVFRTHWLAIFAITLLGGLLAFGWTLTQPKVYTATASAIITTGTSTDIGSALVGDNYAKSRVKSYVDIAKSRRVAEFVKQDLGLTDSADSLVGRVSVSNPLDTAVLRISANAPTSEQSRALAESWIDGMIYAVALLENGVEATDDLPPLDSNLSVVQLRTLDAALAPGAPSSPNVRLSVALGLLVGLALGVGYALIKNAFDKRIRNASHVEQNFDLAVIGTIPFDSGISKNGVLSTTTDFFTTESLRQLRTNLQFMDVDHPPRIIVVTSSVPGDGKSTVTVKLAEAIAESGKKVILVDADLRRPSIAEYLGLLPGVGLTDVLIGRATPDQVLQRYGESGLLKVLGAGPVPPNPSELLGSETMKHLLESLDPEAMILIDTPPLLPVTDAAILTARTDGALVVARAGKTTIDVLDRALANLDKVKGRALGIVIDGVSRKGAGSDAYTKSYSYETRSHSRAKTTPRG